MKKHKHLDLVATLAFQQWCERTYPNHTIPLLKRTFESVHIQGLTTRATAGVHHYTHGHVLQQLRDYKLMIERYIKECSYVPTDSK